MVEQPHPDLFGWGWTFRFGLDDIRRSYGSVLDANKREVRKVERDWNAHKRRVDAGEASSGEYDEDGQLVFDYGEHVGELLWELDSTASLVREAFTIILHHFWEREVKKRSKARYVQPAAVEWLKARGLTPDEHNLNVLRLTVNALKHDDQSQAEALFAAESSLFDTDKMAQYGVAVPEREYLSISEQALDGFFEAVRRSGPRPSRLTF